MTPLTPRVLVSSSSKIHKIIVFPLVPPSRKTLKKARRYLGGALRIENEQCVRTQISFVFCLTVLFLFCETLPADEKRRWSERTKTTKSPLRTSSLASWEEL
jgi:hypothetical protein